MFDASAAPSSVGGSGAAARSLKATSGIAELLRRARDGEERWMIGLVGVLMPGLRRVAGRLTREYPGDPDCIDAAVFALDIEHWLVCGVSWGVTLGLTYAERHPERVTELVFASITMTRASDVHWLYHEAGRFFPEEWARFRSGAPEGGRDGDLVAAYNRLLNEHSDPAVRARAAKNWCDCEDALALARGGVGAKPTLRGCRVPHGVRAPVRSLLQPRRLAGRR